MRSTEPKTRLVYNHWRHTNGRSERRRWVRVRRQLVEEYNHARDVRRGPRANRSAPRPQNLQFQFTAVSPGRTCATSKVPGNAGAAIRRFQGGQT